MKFAAFSLLLSIAPGSGADLPKAAVGVYVQFERTPDSSMPSALRDEVRSILAPFGFNVQWRPMAAAGKEAWVDLAVVTFQGHCDFVGVAFPAFVPGALGRTHVSNGSIQPFADIDCDRIGALLAGPLSLVRAADRERLFQRAVARVVAHELYHIFVRTAAHGDSGVGKAEFTAGDLLSGRFPFHGEPARALLQSSAQDLQEVSARGR